MAQLQLPDLKGRTAVVTGGTGGIGLWTVIGLVKAGATVVIVGRNPAKAAQARDLIAGRTGKPAPDVQFADFASLKAVDALASTLLQRHPKIDILVNNAGLFSPKLDLTADGYERTFAVNCLAPFLLTNRLMPALEAAGRPERKARVVTVSSAAAKGASIDFSDLMSKRRYSMMGSYSRSKLGNLMFTKELARRLSGQPVTANCLHPGVVATEIVRDGIAGTMWALMKPFFLSPEKGAVNSLFVATSPSIEGVSGEYFSSGKIQHPNRQADDGEAPTRFWSECERLVDQALHGTVQAA